MTSGPKLTAQSGLVSSTVSLKPSNRSRFVGSEGEDETSTRASRSPSLASSMETHISSMGKSPLSGSLTSAAGVAMAAGEPSSTKSMATSIPGMSSPLRSTTGVRSLITLTESSTSTGSLSKSSSRMTMRTTRSPGVGSSAVLEYTSELSRSWYSCVLPAPVTCTCPGPAEMLKLPASKGVGTIVRFSWARSM